MGGKTFSTTVRLSQPIYFATLSFVTQQLLAAGVTTAPLHQFRCKTDFGDVDIACQHHPQLESIVRTVFCPTHIQCTSNMISFLHNDHQIDLMLTDSLDMLQFFASFGDLGMILGFLVNLVGLKFGQQGLFVKVLGEKIVLSNRPAKICEFLGLEWQVWQHGFEDVGAMNEWVAASRLFQTAVKCKFTTNAATRRRQQRPVFNEFFTFFTSQTVLPTITSNWQQDALTFFDQHHQVQTLQAKLDAAAKRKTLFHGGLFVECGLKGPQVGVALQAFQNHIVDFETWLATQTAASVKETVGAFCKQFIQTQ